MPRQTEAIKEFEVYEDSVNLIGIARVTLPNIPLVTQTINGAGISGSVEAPVRGHVDVMNATFNFRSYTEDAVRIHTPGKHMLTLMASEQYWDTEAAEEDEDPIKINIIGRSKTMTPGDLAPATTPSATVEYSVSRYEGYRNGTRLWCIDPTNNIYEIMGVDYLEKTRKNTGKS